MGYPVVGTTGPKTLAPKIRWALDMNFVSHEAGATLAQLKVAQEVITLAVFVPFAVIYMGQPLKLDYLWAALCLVGAVYFIFRT
jgi:uncharacterized protein (DUF486 family)